MVSIPLDVNRQGRGASRFKFHIYFFVESVPCFGQFLQLSTFCQIPDAHLWIHLFVARSAMIHRFLSSFSCQILWILRFFIGILQLQKWRYRFFRSTVLMDLVFIPVSFTVASMVIDVQLGPTLETTASFDQVYFISFSGKTWARLFLSIFQQRSLNIGIIWRSLSSNCTETRRYKLAVVYTFVGFTAIFVAGEIV